MHADRAVEARILLFGSIIAILSMDFLTPTGFPIWLFYIIPLLVVAPLQSQRAVLWTFVWIVCFTILGALVSTAGIPLGLALLHRSMGILAFAAIVIFQIFLIRANAARHRSEEQLRIAIEHRDVLMRELSHRVKNSLALVSSILRLEIPTPENPAIRQIIERSTDRIAAVARVYALLDASRGRSTVALDLYFKEIIDSLNRAYLEKEGRVHLTHELEYVELDTRRAVTLGLVTNELITNAIKHAFPEGSRGTILVTLHRTKRSLLLTVRDDGRCPERPKELPASGSVGMGLVRILVQEIGATMSTDSMEGFRVRVDLPFDDGVGFVPPAREPIVRS